MIDSSGPDLGELSWRGIYLPRTMMYRLKDGVDPCAGGTEREDVVDVLSPRETTRSGIMPAREQTLQVQVLQLSRLASQARCHVILEADGEILFHDSKPKPLQEQSRYMRRLVGWLPNIDDTGTLIESFVTMEEADSGRATRQSPNTDDIAGLRINSAHRDPEHGLVYLFHSYFPHTKAQAKFGTLVFYGLLAAVSGLLISVLQGFLMRRFFSRYFDEELPKIMCRYKQGRLDKAGGIVVIPAGMPNAEAFV